MGIEFLKFLITVLVAFFCIVLHNFTQSYVALLNGDRTAKQAGMLTLNPIRHFDFVGFLMLAILRVGYSKSVPINSYYFKKTKVGVLSVAVSGLLVYLLLSFFAVPMLLLCDKFLLPVMSETVAGARGYELIRTVFETFLTAGIGLFLFNLIPINPLDGYKIVEGLFGCTNRFVSFLRDYAKYVFLSAVITFYFADLFGLPYFLNPGYWYVNVLGGHIALSFIRIWLPLF